MSRFGDKLTTSAIALVATTVATNALGLIFWGLAARTHTREAVGGAYAELSALTLLATFSQLNLTNIFVRFLPAAGRFSLAFVRRGYLAVIVVSLGAGSVFVVGGFAANVVGHSLFDRILFVVSVSLFAVFALQDSVMIALRITHWVPVENVSCALAKLALLPAIVVASARTGIIIAWVIPVIVAVIVVSGGLFSRGLTAPERVAQEGNLPGARRLASFVAAEYLTNITAVATTQVMPLLVVWKLGVAANAYFVVPWLAATALSLVLWNVAVSFIVEVVTAAGHSAALLKRSVQLWAIAVTGALIGCVFVGPLVLPLFGHGYAHGASLLRLIGLAAPFLLVMVLYQAFTWLDQRVWQLLAIQVTSSTGFVVLSIVLLPRIGLVGVGWAYLGSRLVGAALMARPVWSRISIIMQAG